MHIVGYGLLLKTCLHVLDINKLDDFLINPNVGLTMGWLNIKLAQFQ